MNIHDMQKDAEQRVERNGWTKEFRARQRCLVNEVEELRVELDAELPGKVKIAHEMFDVVWNLCAIANILQIDLSLRFETKIAELNRRELEGKGGSWDTTYTPVDWAKAATNGDTLLGYTEWYKHKREGQHG